jgi:hypothetical protein
MPKAKGGTLESYQATPDAPQAQVENMEVESLKEMIGNLITEVDYLRREVEETSSMAPKWKTSDEYDQIEQNVLDYDPANIMANLRGRDDDGQAGQMFFGTDSHPIPAMLLRRHGPKFKIGQKVQLNPESTIWGHPGKTWGELCREEGTKGVGIVKKVIHLTDEGEWKYQVRVPGLTTKQGSGFMESELIPVRQRLTKYVVEE